MFVDGLAEIQRACHYYIIHGGCSQEEKERVGWAIGKWTVMAAKIGSFWPEMPERRNVLRKVISPAVAEVAVEIRTETPEVHDLKVKVYLRKEERKFLFYS